MFLPLLVHASLSGVSVISTCSLGTKFSAHELLEGLSGFEDEGWLDYSFPTLAAYNETFSASIPKGTSLCDAYLAAAEKGDLNARLLYGYCLMDGAGRPKDSKQAVNHFKIAADRGSPSAHVFLAVSHMKAGAKRAPDLYKELQLAVKENERMGQFVLGLIHLYSRGTEDATLLKQLAESGFHLGALAYGVCCLFGFKIPEDRNNGAKYLEQLKGERLATLQLLAGLAFHSAGDTAHYPLAAEYFRVAAENGIPAGAAYYGWALENGLGVPKDRTQALEFYQKAVDGAFEPAKARLVACNEAKEL
jgi:TPR repeat protein